MDSVASASGLTMVSKKGMDPSSLLSSTVNFMAESTHFDVLKEAFFVDLLVDDKGTIFSHTPDEAMSGGLAKACVPGKNSSVPEELESLCIGKPILLVVLHCELYGRVNTVDVLKEAFFC